MKPIKGFAGLYSVTRDGRVYSHRSGIFLSGNRDRDGYILYHLKYKQVRSAVKAHRLVAEHYIPRQSKKRTQVNHKNGNKADNRVDNLEWCSFKENMEHCTKQGLVSRGAGRPLAKLTDEKVRKIRESYAAGNHTYFTLADKYKVSYSVIGRVIKGKIWRHVE